MAEPNVTIVSASTPVLRGFIRNVRTRSNSTPRAGTYLKTGENSTRRFYNRTVTAGRAHKKTKTAQATAAFWDGAPRMEMDGVDKDADYANTDQVMRFVVGTDVNGRDDSTIPSELRKPPKLVAGHHIDRCFVLDREEDL
ncbi:hypothetical protein CEP54_014636 [Fusarium duplospermum]|uniref:Uncharacterized protein n=1 Tax=Fusarium duplospermum TaxID=1325734 RepID=A0A428NUT8_9HYPO|nr:hypothetical protein CEP54_014636 [Fusarium duplospermum]